MKIVIVNLLPSYDYSFNSMQINYDNRIRCQWYSMVPTAKMSGTQTMVPKCHIPRV